MNHFGRDAVLMSAADARHLGFANGDKVLLSNAFGTYAGRIAIADVAEQTLQVYWPEGNVLLNPEAHSPHAKIPAYKSVTVRVERHADTRHPIDSLIKV
jgi:formylmethanofuran dehydrogenase subunit D